MIVREAEVHYVDNDTCAHRMLPLGATATAESAHLLVHVQCPQQPEHIAAGLPSCGGHLAMVVRDQYARGNPDVVVRRWV